MSIKYITIPSKRLQKTLSATGTTFKLDSITGFDGNDLVADDFGTQAFGAFRTSDNKNLEIFEFDPTTIANDEITIVNRGLDHNGAFVETTALKQTWIKGETIVELGTDLPQLLQFIQDYADGLAQAGAPDSSETVKGIVEKATSAEIDADTATGTTGPLGVSPDALAASKYGLRLPSQSQKDALNASPTAASTANPYVTQSDVTAIAYDTPVGSAITKGQAVYIDDAGDVRSNDLKDQIEFNVIQRLFLSNQFKDTEQNITCTKLSDSLYVVGSDVIEDPSVSVSRDAYIRFLQVTKTSIDEIASYRFALGSGTDRVMGEVIKVGERKVAFSYRQGVTSTRVRVLTLDTDNVVLAGTSLVVPNVQNTSSGIYPMSMVPVGTDAFIIVYNSTSGITGSSYTISGQNMTNTNNTVISSTQGRKFDTSLINSTKFALSWQQNTGNVNENGFINIIEFGPTSISTVGTAATVPGSQRSSTERTGIVALSETTLVWVAWEGATAPFEQKAYVVTFAGTTVSSFGSEQILKTQNNSSFGTSSVTKVSSDSFLVADNGIEQFGNVPEGTVFASVSGNTITVDQTGIPARFLSGKDRNIFFGQGRDNRPVIFKSGIKNFIGFAIADETGNKVSVQRTGIFKDFGSNSLVKGSKYFLNLDHSTSTDGLIEVGIALNTDDVLITND